MHKQTYSQEHLGCDLFNDFLELFKRYALSFTKNLLDQSVNLLLRLDSVKENLAIEN